METHNAIAIPERDVTDTDEMAKLDISTLERDLAEREANLKASEERNRKLRLLLEHDKRSLARIISLGKRLDSFSDGDVPEAVFASAGIRTSKRPTIKESLLAAIRVVGGTQPTFTSTDLALYWGKLSDSEKPKFDVRANRSNIANYLKEMAEEEKVIERVKAGLGQTPTTYRLTSLRQR